MYRVGYRPGIYHTWADCLEQVKGFKKATCRHRFQLFDICIYHTDYRFLVKSFSNLTDAESFLAGQNPSHTGGTVIQPSSKYYAVKNGRIPGIYTDWPSAQEQITGWTKPKHKCFATRIEAQRFLAEDEHKVADSLDMSNVNDPSSIMSMNSKGQAPGLKKTKKGSNSSAKQAKLVTAEYNEEDFEPGIGPLPPDAEDEFDPNIVLDPETGKVVYKTQEQRQAMKLQRVGGSQIDVIRIHTDGSSLGNGTAGALAGVGVYFGPGDERLFFS